MKSIFKRSVWWFCGQWRPFIISGIRHRDPHALMADLIYVVSQQLKHKHKTLTQDAYTTSGYFQNIE